jgi:CheY-like chemotaxis protein
MAAAAGDDTSTRVRGVERVLVVEDHEDLRAFVVAALRDSGFDVLEAKNGREAIALSEREQQTIHLLLTDVIMPHMTGKEVADLLAKARPQMKVLFISGYSGEVIASHGVLDPNVAYLPKPFSRQDLVDKVRESLG